MGISHLGLGFVAGVVVALNARAAEGGRNPLKPSGGIALS